MSKLPNFRHSLLLNEDRIDRDDSSSSSDGSLLISYKTRKPSSKIETDANNLSEDEDINIKFKSEKKKTSTADGMAHELSPVFHFSSQKDSIEARKAWHLEILLGLFITCTDSELNELSKQSQLNLNCEKIKATKENFNENIKEYTKKNNYANLERTRSSLDLSDQYDSDGDIIDSKLPILYYVIEKRSKWESKELLMSGRRLERTLSNKKRRLPYTSRSLQNLKHKISGEFAKSFQNRVSHEQDQKHMMDRNAFQPYTLQYNECSVSCMSKWAFQTKKKQRINYFYEPLAPKDFRKCAICNRFGHFEVECKELGARLTFTREEMVHALETEELVAKEVRVQSILKEFVQEQDGRDECSKYFHARNREFLSHTFISTEDKTERNEASEKMDMTLFNSINDESLNVSKNISAKNLVNPPLDSDIASCHPPLDSHDPSCQVCDSSLNTIDMLQCAGCNFYFHKKCVEAPDRDDNSSYVCEDCYHYDSDVSSITEIEGLDGFVIEQRKSKNQMHGANHLSDSKDFFKRSWCAPLLLSSTNGSMYDHTGPFSDFEELDGDDQNNDSFYVDEVEEIALDDNTASTDLIQNPKKFTPRPPEWNTAEATIIDGITILSRSVTEECPGTQIADVRNDVSLGDRNKNACQITRFKELIPKTNIPFRGRIGGLAIFKIRGTQRNIIKFGAVAGFKDENILIFNLPNIVFLMHKILDTSPCKIASNENNIDIFSCHMGASEWIPISHVIHLSNFVSTKDLRFYQRSIEKVLTNAQYRACDRNEDHEEQIDTPVGDFVSEIGMPDMPSTDDQHDASDICTRLHEAENVNTTTADGTNENTGNSDAVYSITKSNDGVRSNKLGGLGKETSNGDLESSGESKPPSGKVTMNLDKRYKDIYDTGESSKKKDRTLRSKRNMNRETRNELTQKKYTRASVNSSKVNDEMRKNEVQDKANIATSAKSTRAEKVSSKASNSDQIFEIDTILDDNGIKSKNRQYLIRWKGFSNKYNTWEREENIYHYAIIKQYWCEKYIQKLKRTKQAEDPKSHTSKIIRVLEYGLTKLAECERDTDRVCSFCNRKIRKYDSNHKLVHSAEPNYSIIRDVILFAAPEWYTPFKDWESR